MPVVWTADMDDWFDFVDAIAEPGPETFAALDAALGAAFVQTQADVHVITGALKASGRTSTEVGRSSWEGEIVYGTEEEGPVGYAVYEQARGGDHNFMRNIPAYYDAFEAAILAHLRGE